MREETIYISNADPAYYFTDILKDNGYNGLIPTNSIINKRRPSLGVTHCELYSERNSILIEPFVTVIEVKKRKMRGKICGVMSKEYDINELIAYLTDESIIYKK